MALTDEELAQLTKGQFTTVKELNDARKKFKSATGREAQVKVYGLFKSDKLDKDKAPKILEFPDGVVPAKIGRDWMNLGTPDKIAWGMPLHDNPATFELS